MVTVIVASPLSPKMPSVVVLRFSTGLPVMPTVMVEEVAWESSVSRIGITSIAGIIDASNISG